MKLLISFLIIIVSLNAYSNTLEKIYKSELAPSQFRYLATYRNSVGEQETYMVGFGEDMKFVVLDFGGMHFTLYKNSNDVGVNEDFSVTMLGLNETSFAATIVQRGVKKPLEKFVYNEHSSEPSKAFAMKIDKLVELEFKKFRNMSNPANTQELRRMFRQVSLDNGYGSFADHFPFPVFDLQIEMQLKIEMPDSNLAKAAVNANRDDLISKFYLPKGTDWQRSFDVSRQKIEKLLTSTIDENPTTLASYSASLKYPGLNTQFKRAIRKFLKLEVVTVDGFNCEDSVYTWMGATWILKDGSTVGYHPTSECD